MPFPMKSASKPMPKDPVKFLSGPTARETANPSSAPSMPDNAMDDDMKGSDVYDEVEALVQKYGIGAVTEAVSKCDSKDDNTGDDGGNNAMQPNAGDAATV